MVWQAALALFLVDAAAAPAFPDSPWLQWVADHSPNGFDITRDGTIWINIDPVGAKDDYAVNAEDLKRAVDERGKHPVGWPADLWVRGYHKNNPTVSYRESKVHVHINCYSKTIRVSTAAYYDAKGTMVARMAGNGDEDIIPGTLGAEYHRIACLTD